MKPVYLLLATPLLFASCSLFEKGEYTPEYLKEDSPLDPPGAAAARAEARRKLVKEGMFVDGPARRVAARRGRRHRPAHADLCEPQTWSAGLTGKASP